MEAKAAQWIDLSITGDADLVAGELFEQGALGIEELDQPVGALRGWFPLDWSPTSLPDGCAIVAQGEVDARDWDLSWRLQQEPLIVTQRLTVCPPWVETPAGCEFVLRMEAKQAFGTGGHESTRLAAKMLELLPLQDRTVLDIGAGTGILGFYARQLNASYVELCDIDADALPCLEENAELNHITSYKAWVGSLDALTADARYDVVLANMLRSEFFPMRDQAAALLPVGGHLVLSGYLATERPLVLEWFAQAGFVIDHEATEGDWWGCAGRKESQV